MKNSIFKTAIISLVSFILIIFFLALKLDTNYSTEKLVGKKLDNFEIKYYLKEGLFSRDDLINNEYHLINIWASWCLPCKKEHPVLMKFKNEKKLKLVGINYKDKKINANKFLKKMGNPYDISLVDPDGTKSIIFGVFGVPESILIDKERIIIKKFIGPLNNKDLKDIIKIINEK